MEDQNRAVLFINGELGDPNKLEFFETDFLVAVDNGIRHTFTFNLTLAPLEYKLLYYARPVRKEAHR